MSIQDQIVDHLHHLGQSHLAVGLEELDLEKQRAFLYQIQKYRKEDFEILRKSFFSFAKKIYKDIRPVSSFTLAQDEEDIQRGEELLCQGKVGCIILAGGQGSRLNIQGAKALASVSLIKHKTLLQLFCEKAFYASKSTGATLPLAVLTSPLNHAQIEHYLNDHYFFGLDPGQIHLFTQELKPYLDAKGNLLLKAPGILAEGPDGNGYVLKHFYQSGIWNEWKERGIQYVHLVLIDNPLADPFDPNLCGFHANNGNDVTIKAIFREREEEQMGLLVENKNGLAVIEYSEVSDKEKYARKTDGSLLYNLANISLFCFDMSWIENLATDLVTTLPWHFAEKMEEVFVVEDHRWIQKKMMIYKCETFIFDNLAFAASPQILVYPREETYSPLKNPRGEASVETVQRDLLASDRRQYERVSGMSAADASFELDQAFYYPTKELLNKWKGMALPHESYVRDIL